MKPTTPSEPLVDTGLDLDLAKGEDFKGKFRVCDEHTANWVVRKMVESRQYRDRVKQWAQDEVRRAERIEQTLMHLYGQQLERWCRGALAHGGNRRRSIDLPAGRIGFRKGRPRLVVSDESAVVTWCESNMVDALVVTVECRGEQAVRLRNLIDQQLPDVEFGERVLVSEVRAYIDTTGELPPGSEMEGAKEMFFLK